MDEQPRMPFSLRRALTVLLPVALMTAATCVVLIVLAVGVLAVRQTLQSPETPLVPVTGGETPTVPAPERAPGSYIEQVEQAMLVCYTSFDAFFTVEQMALDDPGLFVSAEWRGAAGEKAVRFRDDCAPLSSLPEPPLRGYDELEELLRASAEEAAAVETAFSGVLAAGETGMISLDSLRDTTHHLVQFIEYTHRAERLLQKMKEQQII